MNFIKISKLIGFFIIAIMFLSSCGGKIPGKKSKEGQYVIPAGLALLNQAIVDREKQNDLFQSYISQDEGATMLPEEIYAKSPSKF